MIYLAESRLFTKEEKGMLMLSTPNNLEVAWDSEHRPNHDDLLPYIMAAVNHSDPKVSDAAGAAAGRATDVRNVRLKGLGLGTYEINVFFFTTDEQSKR